MIHTIILSSSRMHTNNNKCDQININKCSKILLMLSNASTNANVQNTTAKHYHDVIYFEGEENDGTSLCFTTVLSLCIV